MCFWIFHIEHTNLPTNNALRILDTDLMEFAQNQHSHTFDIMTINSTKVNRIGTHGVNARNFVLLIFNYLRKIVQRK